MQIVEINLIYNEDIDDQSEINFSGSFALVYIIGELYPLNGVSSKIQNGEKIALTLINSILIIINSTICRIRYMAW